MIRCEQQSLFDISFKHKTLSTIYSEMYNKLKNKIICHHLTMMIVANHEFNSISYIQSIHRVCILNFLSLSLPIFVYIITMIKCVTS